MATPERVLIDTSALYAIHSDTDLFHRRAIAALEQLGDTDAELWATSYTLVEDGRPAAPAAGLQGRLGVLGVE